MLALTACAMVATFIVLIMTRRLSALTALVLVPVVFALAVGLAPKLGPMMLQGVKDLAPTGVMLAFAILYFGLMMDTGLFDPMTSWIVRMVGSDPLKVTVGTAVMGLLVSLDGDGATTYLICATALMPLYRRLRLDPRILACLLIMASAVMNLLPWGGPTARAAAALKLDPASVFLPLIPGMAATALFVLAAAAWFGVSERRRLARSPQEDPDDRLDPEGATDEPARDHGALRPKLFVFNLALTIALMVALVMGLMPLPVLFMLAFALALAVNYPSLDDQRARMQAHAPNALAVAGLIFAAGAFTGILSGGGFVDALGAAVVAAVPSELGAAFAPVVAALSLPFTFLISNDAFYFGLFPILAETGTAYGIAPDALARAALVGQQVHLLSPLVPSTYLLVNLAGIEFGQHLRFTLPWALGACLVMFLACVAFGVFPLVV